MRKRNSSSSSSSTRGRRQRIRDRQAAALDALESYYDPGQFVDIRDYLPNNYLRPNGVYPTTVNDRREGRYLPVFQSEGEMAIIRGMARALVDGNPMASGAIEALADYTIDKGFKYKCTSTNKQNPKQNIDLVRQAQAVVDEFIDLNDWCGDLDRELFTRTETDGESFCGLWHVGGGKVKARAIEPDQVTEPSGSREIEDWLGCECPSSWTFGVHTDLDDVEERHGYYCQWSGNPTDWDYLPGGDEPHFPPGSQSQDCWVEHYKIGTPRNVKRGLSAFFSTRTQFDLAKKLLRNVGEGASVQSAIAFFREHAAGVSAAQIQAFRSSRATRTFTEQAATSTRTGYTQKFEPGTVVDHGKGISYKLSALGNNNAPVFIDVVDAQLRSAGVKWRMPQHIITGTAEGASYASILVAESPFVKATTVRQWRVIRSHQRIFWRVLWFGWKAGRFGDGITWEEFLRQIELQIEPPQVAVRDPDKDTARRKILRDAGILSDRDWSAMEGLDYDLQRQNGAARTDTTAAVGAAAGTSTVPPSSHPDTPRSSDQIGHPLMDNADPLAQADAAAAPSVVPAAPVAPSVDGHGIATAAAAGKQNVQVATDLVLNGAQIQAALQIVLAVAGGELPRDTGLGQLKVLFNLTAEQAEQIMGSAGTSVPTTPNPKPPGSESVTTATTESFREKLSQRIHRFWGSYP